MKKAINKSAKSLWKMFPIIMGIIMLIALVNASVPSSLYIKLFTNNDLIDPVIGAIAGSISTGTPVVSYIISGELLKSGVSLVAVTAFLLAWVTVGIIQMPAEAMILGKKFTIVRNISAFIFAIIIAIIMNYILSLF